MKKNGLDNQIGAVISEDEHKQIQLEILKVVAQFCEEHNLRYFLADGTLIGAIRHHGFIPWDDDIDIRMPFPDYLRIIESFNDEVGNRRYRLIAPNDDMAQHYMVKIIDTATIKLEPYLDYSKGYLGVDIDVFPLSGSPDDEEFFLKWADEICEYNKAYVYKKRALYRSVLGRVKDVVKNRQKAKIIPLISCKEIFDRVCHLEMQYSYDGSRYISGVGIRDRFRTHRSCYEDYCMMPFEDAEFRVPIGYDQILTAEYGDYMTLPPVEKQVTHHNNKVFWKVNG